ncbi:MAG TPA: uroporphyrinogen decarboxylase family protein, partial [Dermatophilaceae bacterium]|nr:uroporphyrinogen decarboxylase family protein [Dermatophilaceae bacterium]
MPTSEQSPVTDERRAVGAESSVLPPTHPLVTGRTSGSILVRAYRGERTATRPIWMMRQAGRSLPEYRA